MILPLRWQVTGLRAFSLGRSTPESHHWAVVSALSEDGVMIRSPLSLSRLALIALFGIAMTLVSCASGSTSRQPVDPHADSTTTTQGSPARPAQAFQARVTRVVDGDTFIASADGRDDIRVRLIGVNAPEIAHFGQTVQCFGLEATQVLKNLIVGKTVSAAYETGGRTDKYGRDLWDVWLGDGRFVQAELVGSGAARARAYRPQTQFASFLMLVQSRAQRQDVGLWSQCTAENR